MNELQKLEQAIKHFEEKLSTQGLVKNARDVEHLERLQELHKQF